jgi:Caspase domain
MCSGVKMVKSFMFSGKTRYFYGCGLNCNSWSHDYYIVAFQPLFRPRSTFGTSVPDSLGNVRRGFWGLSMIIRLVVRMAVLASVAAVSLAVSAPPALAEKRIALVVGNNDYRNIPPLRTAVNDARAMGDTLKQLGFSVMVAENQTRKGFTETLLAFDQVVEPGDTAFFFFAGHGFEVGGENYLLPTDVAAASEGQEELIRDGAMAAERVISRLQKRGARTSIFVFDACRNNPFERSGTRALAGGGGLAAMTPPEGVFVVFSAGAKQTALDRLSDGDTNPNSVFTRNFVRELAQPGLDLVQITKRTQSDVRDMTATVHHLQTPAYYDQIVGDVVLNGASGNGERAIAVLPQVAALPVVPAPRLLPPAGDSVNAPIASFSRHNSGWTVVISIADPALAISWRMGESGEFKETGFLDTLDPRTRRRLPSPSFELPTDAPEATLQIRYVDVNGEMQGPFPIKFDPEAALVRDQRKILDLTATSWLSFREYNGLLVYYTHLMSYRCAIREMRIGIDTGVPDKVVKLPACNPKDPSAIPYEAQPYLKLPPSTKSVSVELTFQDGSVSEIKSFRR